MNKQDVQNKIEEAKQLVGRSAADPFTQIAFEVVLRKLMEEGEVEKVAQRTPSKIPKMYINEILTSKNVKTHLDKVEAIAWHFLREGDGSVNRKEILEAYGKARMKRPQNLTDVITQSVKRSHLIDSPEKKDGEKAWCITPTGEKYVEENLLGEARQ